MLEIKDLHVEIEGREILKGVSLKLEDGKTYALMGPNGSGKSTLANVIMGNPKYNVVKGKIILNGKEIEGLGADERAKQGLFLSFQYPKEISGVTITQLLRSALNGKRQDKISTKEFNEVLSKNLEKLNLNKEFIERYLNQGFSGGEKKKAEILQMLVLDPDIAILDETDSGLDIDALKIVASGIKKFMNKKKIALVITHYKRILEYVKPDVVIIMKEGKIVHTGDGKLVDKLEEKGYGWVEE